ncbi:helix-turn-helix transcriptional regulator [Allopusillimonas ginsengisoli]|uniref:helix-turn-helix transcriptional regulator n=1 Tax=Allopusillimonas ginsengisoli TaxID=453575 RepID=UPI0010C1AD4D|nr:helix-turn-helix transcriptional regulator [Allopusillimonas ginsengisoli]
MPISELNAPDHNHASPIEEVMLARLARNCIERHYGKLHSLSDLASMLRTDPSSLDRVLLQVCGKGGVSLLNDMRFLAAQRLLVQSSLTLKEIATAVGFEHPSEFTSAFHEHVGLNPWAYRHSPYHEIITSIQGDIF